MKNLICFLLSALCCSCISYKTADAPAAETLSVEVAFIPQGAEPITRATDEQAIKSVNFYLFAKSVKSVIHVYSEVSSLQFDCQPGEYDIYVAANIQADLPMSGKATVKIAAPASGSKVVLPAIEMRRCRLLSSCGEPYTLCQRINQKL